MAWDFWEYTFDNPHTTCSAYWEEPEFEIETSGIDQSIAGEIAQKACQSDHGRWDEDEYEETVWVRSPSGVIFRVVVVREISWTSSVEGHT